MTLWGLVFSRMEAVAEDMIEEGMSLSDSGDVGYVLGNRKWMQVGWSRIED